jgi:hypothetical protein
VQKDSTNDVAGTATKFINAIAPGTHISTYSSIQTRS